MSNGDLPPIIRGKLRAPPLPEAIVARPRLDRSLAELIASHRVVVVAATAGAGKTTAVAAAVRNLGGAVAWLSLDRTDQAPGRLLTYLEAALAVHLPHLAGTVGRGLAAGIPHPEVAGLLSDAAGDEPVVFVIDDLERLGRSPEAWAVIEGFIRHAAPEMSLVLMSRLAIPARLCELPSADEVAVLGEEELAFTTTEAAQALASRGGPSIDAASAVAATGGWVTGVLFESWRATSHVAGLGGDADPLYGYLSSHILEELPQSDRDFLVATSLLDDVTAARAAALGVTEGGARLAALRASHLPVSWHNGGRTLRCHPRFREYLRDQLEQGPAARLTALRLAHARLLADEARPEEATDEFLLAGALDEALPVAEHVILDVVERLDTAVAERWLAALAGVAEPRASPLATAELMLAVGQDDYRRGAAVADRLAEAGQRDTAAQSSERTAALMAWCYGSVNRFADGRAVLAVAEQGPTVEAVLYGFRLFDAAPYQQPRPELTGEPLDAIVYWSVYHYGRLSELTQDPESPWVEALAHPWRIAALRASGHTQQALEAYESAQASGHQPVFLEAIVGPEVLNDAGRHAEARDAVTRARARARRSSPWFELWNGITAAKLALRHDEDPGEGLDLLRRAERVSAAAEIPIFRELLDTWLGLGLLRRQADGEALEHLRRATRSMLDADRLLELPTAAVYLAEAEWRAGNEDEADRAADLAVDAARRQGSNHLLLQALTDFPAVASRRIDAEPHADSAWHALGRALIAQDIVIEAPVGVPIALQEYGRTAIVVDGNAVRPKIKKSFELLAYLVARREAILDRSELLDVLFDGRDDRSTRAYLREAARQLRQVLPAGSIVAAEGGGLGLTGTVQVAAESALFEARLLEAGRLQGAERLAATLDALAIADQGEYLPGVRSPWAEERRRELANVATDARFEAAETAYALGEYQHARRLADAVLAADPFREAGWRLSMRVASALGDEDGIIHAFRECERVLAQFDAGPSSSTQLLLEELRR